MKKISLRKQLFLISGIIVSIIIITLGIILPRLLTPIYEENIYKKLKQPLIFINNNSSNTINYDTDIAYIYIVNGEIKLTYNVNKVITNYSPEILKYITNDSGKFIYNHKKYYYSTLKTNYETKISITNDNYINKVRHQMLLIIFLISSIAFTITTLIIVLWSNNVVEQIRKLKDKVNNLDNVNYESNIHYIYDDELYSLNQSIDNMKEYLIKEEQYKNQIYQNISHDLKTPITVIKSYIEAEEDGIETKENTLKVISEQVNKLETKVHSLLYLNKLNYVQDQKELLNVNTNIVPIINSSITKFKVARNDIKFIFDYDDHTNFRGTTDMWEAIIDNILNNFIRYAKKEIKINIKSKKITLYNDGENIDEKLINNIFTPYEKGINGVFGLGLSIVKKTLQFLNYDIAITNMNKGVKFIIK